MALTLRNWLIGFYIKEYEQNGRDRTEYGANLIYKLVIKLQDARIPATALSSLRQFYEQYPEIRQTLSGELEKLRQ
ncbi:MAG: DUF1016 N-terminal domain-containing protein [Neisseriaceae bacterium]